MTGSGPESFRGRLKVSTIVARLRSRPSQLISAAQRAPWLRQRTAVA